MELFKCEDCGLITSEEFFACPKCNSEKNKIRTSANKEMEVIYMLTMEDADSVIEDNFSEKEKAKLKAIPRNVLEDTLTRKLEIEWYEYIEACIRARLL